MSTRLPTMPRVAATTALSAAVSIAVNAGFIWLGTSTYPLIRDYSHFRFADYGTLTVVGVVAAGIAWSFVVRMVPSPRQFFARLAVVVTLALLLPDVWLLVSHESVRAVAVLMAMHLATAIITYNLLVRVAPVVAGDRSPSGISAGSSSNQGDEVTAASDLSMASKSSAVSRPVWTLMLAAVIVELVVGLAGMLYVPLNRPSGWIAHKGVVVYLVHAVLGGALGVGAIAIVMAVVRSEHVQRLERISALTGLCGVIVGALGGLLCYSHSLRLLGMGLMFLGISIAFFGYLMPLAGDGAGMPVAQSERTGQSSDGLA